MVISVIGLSWMVAHSLFLKRGDHMTVFESLVLMIAFATLTVAILSEQKK